MSFRIENKILVNKDNFYELNKFLKENSAKTLFPKRKIKSLYFDNSNYQMFDDSEEGCLPRKKIRVRHYPGTSDVLNLEIKVSSVEGKFKTSHKLNKEKFILYQKKGLSDNLYGWCKPVIWTEYLRNYYQIEDYRITYDTNIQYLNVSEVLIGKESSSVLEIKASANADLDKLDYLFPNSKTRFSKFSNVIRFLR